MYKYKLSSFTWMFCIAALLVLASGIYGAPLQPGDANGDFAVNISDAVWIINYVFVSGEPPPDMHVADVNGDCAVNVSDAVTIINYIFLDGSGPLSNDCIHLEKTGSCLERDLAPDSGYVYIEVLGNDLHVHHMDAYYQCCLEFFMEYSFEESIITAQETDIGDPCDCICYFDSLRSVYYDLDDGQYTVIVLGIYGDTMAVEEIVVDGDYGLSGHSSYGCLKGDFDGDPPIIDYTFENGILIMSHGNAYFNCGGKIVAAFEQASDTLRFFEINVSDLWAYCMCYFAVSASVDGLAPGVYTAEVYAREPMDAPDALVDRREIILP
ncbi:MAG TPA: hypothetical protein ENO22_11165 [candidate division Zixibacteria bacterium]|nr:hypothetical protein [candidate division Zixibacteria bacterium]